MATIRSYMDAFATTDLTPEINTIPNTWGMIGRLGIFQEESVSQHTITVSSVDQTLGIIPDQLRGARNNVNKDDTRNLRPFAIPHFPVDDGIKPDDIQGKRAYGNTDAVETLNAVMARKLQRIRRNHAITLEAARAYALTTGGVFAPNGTVVDNFYTSFGITRKEVDFTLGNGAVDPKAKIREVVEHIQDNALTGEEITKVVALVSPEFFAKLISHPQVADAYRYYSSQSELLRTGLGQDVSRRFVYAEVEFVEYRGTYPGIGRLIPAGDAYFFPANTGSDMFVTYFSPANKFEHVNTLGEKLYAFIYPGQTDEQILIQTEHNALNVLRKPQVVVRAFSSN